MVLFPSRVCMLNHFELTVCAGALSSWIMGERRGSRPIFWSNAVLSFSALTVDSRGGPWGPGQSAHGLWELRFSPFKTGPVLKLKTKHTGGVFRYDTYTLQKW